VSPVSVASLHRAQFWYQDIYSLLHGNCLQLRTVTEEEIDRYYLISVMERETTGHETSACLFFLSSYLILSVVRPYGELQDLYGANGGWRAVERGHCSACPPPPQLARLNEKLTAPFHQVECHSLCGGVRQSAVACVRVRWRASECGGVRQSAVVCVRVPPLGRISATPRPHLSHPGSPRYGGGV
jgi:hypothetical protein